MKPVMNVRFLAPLALPIFLLSGCGQSAQKDDAPAAPVKAVAAPAGTSWAEQVVETPEGGIRMGNPNAPIKLIEYGSYTCSHCRDFSADSHEAIERDYVNTGKVSFEYRHMIRDQLDMAVVMVARCSGPETFFAFSAQAFAGQTDMFNKIQAAGPAANEAIAAAPPAQRLAKLAEFAGMVEFAKQRGVPEEKLKACLTDQKLAARLAKASSDVITKYPDFPGTPSFLLNGVLLDKTASWDTLAPKLKNAGA
jgi:protein-disulfide isomerase